MLLENLIFVSVLIACGHFLKEDGANKSYLLSILYKCTSSNIPAPLKLAGCSVRHDVRQHAELGHGDPGVRDRGVHGPAARPRVPRHHLLRRAHHQEEGARDGDTGHGPQQ